MSLAEGFVIAMIALVVLIPPAALAFALYRKRQNEKLKSNLRRAINAGLLHFGDLDRQKKGSFGVSDIDRMLAQGPSMGIERGGLVLLKKYIHIIGHVVSEKTEFVPMPIPYSVVPVVVEQKTDRVYGVSKADLEDVDVEVL